MKARGPETSLVAADPVKQNLLDQVDLAALEVELLADLDDEQPAPSPLPAEEPHQVRRLALATGIAVLAAVTAVVVLASGSSQRASRAYGAELVRFAETLEKVVVGTIEAGFMTKDLALLVGADQAWLSTTGFLDKIDERLEEAMADRAAA